MAPVPDDDVDLLVDFLNTIDEEQATDEFADDAECAAWFRDHGGATRSGRGATDIDAATARAVRTALRESADGSAAPPPLPGVPIEITLDDDGEPSLHSAHPLGPMLITAVRLGLEGRWRRIKLCDMH